MPVTGLKYKDELISLYILNAICSYMPSQIDIISLVSPGVWPCFPNSENDQLKF